MTTGSFSGGGSTPSAGNNGHLSPCAHGHGKPEADSTIFCTRSAFSMFQITSHMRIPNHASQVKGEATFAQNGLSAKREN